MRIGSLGSIGLAILTLLAIVSIASAAQWEEDSYLNFSDGAAVNVNIIDESGDGSITLSTGAASGTYTSNWHNTGAPRKYEQINWQAEVPDGTNIKFQIRTKQNGYVLGPLGPDGTMNSYYTNPSTISSSHDGYSEIQYIAYLTTIDITKTPKLKMVQINYSDEAIPPIPVFLGGNSEKPVPPVPEPLSIILLSIGLIALLGLNIFKR